MVLTERICVFVEQIDLMPASLFLSNVVKPEDNLSHRDWFFP